MTAPTTPILDAFPADGGPPPPGGNWTNYGPSGLVVTGGKCTGTGVFFCASYWSATTFQAGSEAYVTIETRPADGEVVGLDIRFDPVAETSYSVIFKRDDALGDTITVNRMDAGYADTQLDLVTQAMLDGDAIWVKADGSTITTYHKPSGGSWTAISTVTDATYSNAGYLLLRADGNTARLEDFGGGNFVTTAWTDAARSIAAKLEIDWDKDGVFTDESAYLLAEGGATGRCGLLMPWQMFGGINAQEPWTARFALKNVDDRFSATNTDGPYYASIGTNKGRGIPLKFSVGLDDGAGNYTYTVIFTGYIDMLSIDSTTRDLATISAIDNAMMLLQHRTTTTLYIDETADSWLTVLATFGNVAATSFDPGRCIIPYAWLDDEQLWPEMNKVAHADGGFVYFNQAGTLIYENAETWITLARHTASQYTFTVSRWQDMAPKFDWNNCYNEVVCQYQPRALRGRQEIWTLEQCDRRILPGETRTITARLRYPCAAIFTPAANVDYHVISEMGKDMTSAGTNSVAVSISAYAQRVEITIVNSDASRTAYLHDFKLRGIPLIGYPAGQVKQQATGSDIGDPTSAECKTLAISNNEYIQTLDQAQLIAASLKDRLQKARLTYRITNVPGIPTLIPGDLVTVVEAGSEVNNTGFILSYDWTFSRGAFDFTTVEVLDSANWTPYTAAQYFILGTDSPNATTSKRVFY